MKVPLVHKRRFRKNPPAVSHLTTPIIIETLIYQLEYYLLAGGVELQNFGGRLAQFMGCARGAKNTKNVHRENSLLET